MSSTIVLPTGELVTREHSNTTTTTEIDKERRRQQQQTTSTGVTTTAVAMGREGEGEVATTVCCGCRPRRSKYFDVDVGADSVWENNDDDDDSMYFFDAEQEPLGPDDYPIVFTTSLQRPKPKVSFNEPESMLRDFQDPEDDSSTNSDTAEKSSSSSPSPDYAPIKNFKIPSARFREITRRSSVEIQNALETPRVKCEERGYPGGLTVEELKECVSLCCLYPFLLVLSNEVICPTNKTLTVYFCFGGCSKNSCVVSRPSIHEFPNKSIAFEISKTNPTLFAGGCERRNSMLKPS